jgi:prevent-host-death family protein
MKSEQCISVTDLSKNASNIIKKSANLGLQYIFVNNKPKAVIIDYAIWESLEESLPLSPEIHQQYLEARRDLDR